VADNVRRELALEGLLSDGLIVDTEQGFRLPE
jgi:hypothetical protein